MNCCRHKVLISKCFYKLEQVLITAVKTLNGAQYLQQRIYFWLLSKSSNYF